VFQGLISDAKSAAASFVDTYLARASVAVPFVVAAGFATAAASLALTERFGATKAFWMMAAGFCAIGLVAAMIVTIREQETTAAKEQQGNESGLGDIGEMASAVATQAAGQLPKGLLLSLLGSPASVQALARSLVRNVPLLLLLALLALLFWPTDEETERPCEEEAEPLTDGPSDQPPASDASIREAA